MRIKKKLTIESQFTDRVHPEEPIGIFMNGTSFKITLTLIAFLLHGCATSSASSKAHARKKLAQGQKIPSLSESYAFDDTESTVNDHIRKRGNKARGTHDY